MADEQDYFSREEFHRNFSDIDFADFQSFTAKITYVQAALIIVYAILFAIGVGGNAWVVCVIGSIWRHWSQFHNAGASEPQRTVQLFILCLCCCDLVVLAFVALLITDLYYGQWVVTSPFLCKLYLSSEALNKFCSPFLLVGLSGYCYYSICGVTTKNILRNSCEINNRGAETDFSASARAPPKSGYGVRRAAFFNTYTRKLTDSKYALLIIFTMCSLIFILVSPVYIYGDLHYVVNWNGTNISEIKQKCALSFPPALHRAFTCYSFIGGYLVPAVSFTFFYTALLARVRRQTQKVRRRPSSSYFGRVAKTAMGLVVFYICCWTPYWTIMLHHTFGPVYDENIASAVFAYMIHLLPYINCCGYPILYTLLNRNIKETYKKIANGRRRSSLAAADIYHFNTWAAASRSFLCCTGRSAAAYLMDDRATSAARKRFSSLSVDMERGVTTAIDTTL